MQQDNFGCAVTNRFDRLLDDEADPFDILREAERQKQKKKKENKKADLGKQGKKESQKDRKVHSTGDGGVGQRNTSGWRRMSRGGYIQNENKDMVVTEREQRRVAFRERRPNHMESPGQFFADASQDRWNKGSRGREWGQGMGKGYSRNSDRFDQGAKKEPVNPEKSGIQSQIKNFLEFMMPCTLTRFPGAWEGKQPLNITELPPYLTVGNSDCESWEPEGEYIAAKEGQEAVEQHSLPPVEEELAEEEAVPDIAMEMSLDEWKALLEQSRPKEELQLRKVDARVPSKAVVIHKSKHLEGKGVIGDEDNYVFRRPANDITTSLAFNFGNLPRPGRGGRGARGGQRGRAQYERAPAPPAQVEMVLAPNPDDPEDFPALG